MKVQLAFNDWLLKGESVYSTHEGLILSSGDFHSGSTFNVEIELTPEQERELDEAITKGYRPAFYVVKKRNNIP